MVEVCHIGLERVASGAAWGWRRWSSSRRCR